MQCLWFTNLIALMFHLLQVQKYCCKWNHIRHATLYIHMYFTKHTQNLKVSHMVVDHLTDVHFSRLCINLHYNDFLLFNGELQLNTMIMLIWYTLKLNVFGSFQCRTPYIKFHLHPFKNQTARLDFPTKSSLLSNMEKRQKKIKLKNQHQLSDISQLPVCLKTYLPMEYIFIPVDI